MNDKITRFRIGSKLYAASSLDEISLRDMLEFESEPLAQRIGVKWSDIEQVAQEMADLDEDAAGTHPKAMLMIAVTIWASRKAAGENVSFDEATDFKMKELTFLPPTEDHQPDPTSARKGAKKKPSKPASAADVAPVADEAAPTT